MFTTTLRRFLPVLMIAAFVLAACGGDEAGPADSIDLEGTDTDDANGTSDSSDTSDSNTSDAPTEDAADTGTDAPAADGEASGDATPQEPGDAVDTTEAVAGTWPIGDAGTVTFSLVDGALTLDEVVANDGWQTNVDKEDRDEIEVDLRGEDVEWQFEAELEDQGSRLKIQIDQDIDDAAPGTYDLGDAGTFTFEVTDGRLTLVELALTEGWTQQKLEEEDDEIEFDIVSGSRQFEVQIDLEDDGRVEVDIEYEVVGDV